MMSKNLIAMLVGSFILLGCGTDDVNQLNASQDRSLKEAPLVEALLSKWKRKLAKEGKVGKVVEGKSYESLKLEKTVDENPISCIKLKNDRKSLLSSFFDISIIEAGLTATKQTKAQFRSLFNKKRFGKRNIVCDLSASSDPNTYSKRIFYSGDGKFSLVLEITYE
jgi:hypothetical protein